MRAEHGPVRETGKHEADRSRTLVIPVETINRELDAKLHLALRAVMRGWKVILGGRANINHFIPQLPPSIYISKGLRVGNKHILRFMEGFGHVPVALDEESLIRQSDEALLMMLDDETFNRPRLLFAWGQSNADVWRRFKGYRGTPILEIGNPRMDLLRPELAAYFTHQVQSIRERFGDFVLVSTNFSMVNHFIPEHVRFATATDADAERADALRDGLKAHKKLIFEAFIAAIPDMARAVAPMTLVIRPHPSENPKTWEAAAVGLPNVKVIHEGPIGPWLMAARGLVQNGCTSAVEAGVVGTPALAFRPHVSDQFEVELSNRVSRDCRSLPELIVALKSLPTKGPLPEAQLAYLRTHIASVDGAFSCDRLLDALDNHADRLIAPPPSGGLAMTATRLGHFRRYPLRDTIKGLRKMGSAKSYRAHKFPGLPEDAVTSRIERLRAVRPELPFVTVTRLADSIYAITTGAPGTRE
jgi:surface carbohydrate biosynthesis protein